MDPDTSWLRRFHACSLLCFSETCKTHSASQGLLTVSLLTALIDVRGNMDRCMLVGDLASEISIFNKDGFNSLAAWLTLIFFRLCRKRKIINNFIKYANRHFHIHFHVCSVYILQKIELHFKYSAMMPLLMQISIQVIALMLNAHVTQLKLTCFLISSSWKHSRNIWSFILKYMRCRFKIQNHCHRTTKFKLSTWNKFQDLCYQAYSGQLTIIWETIAHMRIKQNETSLFYAIFLTFATFLCELVMFWKESVWKKNRTITILNIIN